jgi:hypothetical protein
MAELHKLRDAATPVTATDLVFVHGLGGDSLKTWGLQTSPNWVDWLSTARPGVAFWSIDYDAAPSQWLGSAMSLADRATNLLALLDGRGFGSRPLVFLTHSLGGLLVKAMLRQATTFAEAYVSIARSTRGIVFFGTPHAGSDAATFASYLNFFLRTTVTTEELRAHDSQLRELNQWYRSHSTAMAITTRVFVETRRTSGLLVVDPTSADPGIAGVQPIPIDADHFSLCKPHSETDIVVLQVGRLLDSVLASVPHLMGGPDPVSQLSGRLLAATSHSEIKQIGYELQALMQDDTTPQLLALRDQVESAARFHAPLELSVPLARSERLSYTVGMARMRPGSWMIMGLFVAVIAAAILWALLH